MQLLHLLKQFTTSETASLADAQPDLLIATSLMPKDARDTNITVPFVPGVKPSQTNPWLRVRRLAGLPFREDQSALEWAASEKALLSIVHPVISDLRDPYHTTCT